MLINFFKVKSFKNVHIHAHTTAHTYLNRLAATGNFRVDAFNCQRQHVARDQIKWFHVALSLDPCQQVDGWILITVSLSVYPKVDKYISKSDTGRAMKGEARCLAYA